MAGQDQTQVIAGRNMVVYTAPWVASTGSPTNLNTGAPADTITWGTAWGTVSGFVWEDKGFTRDGLRFRLNVTRNDVNVDQLVDPVLRIPQRRDMHLQTALAQINAQNLRDASGQGTISTVPPASGVSGHVDFIFSGTIVDQYLAAGFDIQNPGDLLPIRIFGWKGLVMADVEMQFQVTDAARIAFDIALIPDTSTTPSRIATFRDVTAPLP